jgi:FkbM family methyltransferase
MMDLLRRARIAGQSFKDIANWREVLPRAARGQAVTEIRLRNGTIITAPPEVALWPHFSDIWYHRSYTKHCPIPRDAVVVDIGANVGVFSLLAARAARLVYSLEPATSNFSRLASNVSGTQNIIPLNLACAGRDGQGALDLSTDPVSFSLMKNTCSDKQEAVDIVSLGTLFERNRISRCDFLKLDCEGSEFEIILDSEPSVMGRVNRIVLEYHDHLSVSFSHRELLQRLESLGFRAIAYNSRGTYGMIAAVKT